MAAAPTSTQIIESLKSTPNADEAISLTLLRESNAYSTFKYVRQRILHNTESRHPQYLQRLRDLQYRHFSPQDPEWELLEHLYHSPLHHQYRVETSPKAYLTDHPDLDKALKLIHSVHENFYLYRMPDEVVERAIEKERESRELKHARAVTITDLQMILCRAREWRRCAHPWELVACALFLCGRRVGEVLSSLEWEYHGPYTANVSGLTKQDASSATIPLLCTYEDFDELMQRIRETQLPTTSTTHRLKPAYLRVFGEWFNHSQRRNIYGEAGYRMRHESGFYPDMSKIMWIDKALAHTTNVVHTAGNLVYQSLVFNDE
jgi:hypothetical protein